MNVVDLSKLKKVNIKGVTSPLKFLDVPIHSEKLGIYMTEENIQRCLTAGVIVECYKKDGSVFTLKKPEVRNVLEPQKKAPSHTPVEKVVEKPVVEEPKKEEVVETPNEIKEDVVEDKKDEDVPATESKIKFNKKKNKH